jgi:hypothetical protein
MSPKNKHGLDRYIPADVRRTVRQRDGFGCVVCGSAIYTYEHVDPEFADAEKHDARFITLLCAGCHDRVTRGLLSKDSVKEAMANPQSRVDGFSFGPLDIGSSAPEIRIGPVTARNVEVIVRAMGEDILKVEKPETSGGPYRVSAFLTNASGSETLRIDRNEWITSSSNWDVQVEGRRITIHDSPGDITLVLRAEPPHAVIIERLDMFHKGMQLEAQEDGDFTVVSPSGRRFTATGMNVEDCQVAIDVGARGSMSIGQGGGSVYIKSLVSGFGPSPAPLGEMVPVQQSLAPAPASGPRVARSSLPKVGRNELCPCGSGEKFKRCCL